MSELEQVLAYLGANEGLALVSGWVEKQPVDHRTLFNRFWRRKWMELFPQLIVWYNDGCAVPRAYMMLSPTTLVRESSGKGSAIEVGSASGRTLRFRASDAQQHHRWFAGITQVLTEGQQGLSLCHPTATSPLDVGASSAKVVRTAFSSEPQFPPPPPPVRSDRRSLLSQNPNGHWTRAQAAAEPAAADQQQLVDRQSDRASASDHSVSDRSSAGDAGDSPGRQRLRQHSLYRMRSLEEAEVGMRPCTPTKA